MSATFDDIWFDDLPLPGQGGSAPAPAPEAPAAPVPEQFDDIWFDDLPLPGQAPEAQALPEPMPDVALDIPLEPPVEAEPQSMWGQAWDTLWGTPNIVSAPTYVADYLDWAAYQLGIGPRFNPSEEEIEADPDVGYGKFETGDRKAAVLESLLHASEALAASVSTAVGAANDVQGALIQGWMEKSTADILEDKIRAAEAAGNTERAETLRGMRGKFADASDSKQAIIARAFRDAGLAAQTGMKDAVGVLVEHVGKGLVNVLPGFNELDAEDVAEVDAAMGRAFEGAADMGPFHFTVDSDVLDSMAEAGAKFAMYYQGKTATGDEYVQMRNILREQYKKEYPIGSVNPRWKAFMSVAGDPTILAGVGTLKSAGNLMKGAGATAETVATVQRFARAVEKFEPIFGSVSGTAKAVGKGLDVAESGKLGAKVADVTRQSRARARGVGEWLGRNAIPNEATTMEAVAKRLGWDPAVSRIQGGFDAKAEEVLLEIRPDLAGRKNKAARQKILDDTWEAVTEKAERLIPDEPAAGAGRAARRSPPPDAPPPDAPPPDATSAPEIHSVDASYLREIAENPRYPASIRETAATELRRRGEDVGLADDTLEAPPDLLEENLAELRALEKEYQDGVQRYLQIDDLLDEAIAAGDDELFDRLSDEQYLVQRRNKELEDSARDRQRLIRYGEEQQKYAREAGLEPDELRALNYWTNDSGDAFENIKNAQWGKSDDPIHASMAKSLERAVEKLPTYTGVAYRGMYDVGDLSVGEVFQLNSFNSFSKSPKEAAPYGSLHIRVENGKFHDISDVPQPFDNELEILNVPGQKYRVKGIKRENGRRYVSVEQVSDDVPISTDVLYADDAGSRPAYAKANAPKRDVDAVADAMADARAGHKFGGAYRGAEAMQRQAVEEWQKGRHLAVVADDTARAAMADAVAGSPVHRGPAYRGLERMDPEDVASLRPGDRLPAGEMASWTTDAAKAEKYGNVVLRVDDGGGHLRDVVSARGRQMASTAAEKEVVPLFDSEFIVDRVVREGNRTEVIGKFRAADEGKLYADEAGEAAEDFARLFNDGDDAATVLRNIPEGDELQKIAEDLLEIGDAKGLGVKLRVDPEAKRSFYNVETDEIVVKASSAARPKTLVHEIIHGLTAKTLRESDAARASIDELLELARENIPEAYGLKNRDEFLAEAFSSEGFRAQLRAVRYDEKRSLWGKFLDFVRKAVGMRRTPPSLLDEVVSRGSDVIRTPRQGAEATDRITQTIANMKARPDRWANKQQKRIAELTGVKVPEEAAQTTEGVVDALSDILAPAYRGAIDDLLTEARAAGLRVNGRLGYVKHEQKGILLQNIAAKLGDNAAIEALATLQQSPVKDWTRIDALFRERLGKSTEEFDDIWYGGGHLKTEKQWVSDRLKSNRSYKRLNERLEKAGADYNAKLRELEQRYANVVQSLSDYKSGVATKAARTKARDELLAAYNDEQLRLIQKMENADSLKAAEEAAAEWGELVKTRSTILEDELASTMREIRRATQPKVKALRQEEAAIKGMLEAARSGSRQIAYDLAKNMQASGVAKRTWWQILNKEDTARALEKKIMAAAEKAKIGWQRPSEFFMEYARGVAEEGSVGGSAMRLGSPDFTNHRAIEGTARDINAAYRKAFNLDFDAYEENALYLLGRTGQGVAQAWTAKRGAAHLLKELTIPTATKAGDVPVQEILRRAGLTPKNAKDLYSLEQASWFVPEKTANQVLDVIKRTVPQDSKKMMGKALGLWRGVIGRIGMATLVPFPAWAQMNTVFGVFQNTFWGDMHKHPVQAVRAYDDALNLLGMNKKEFVATNTIPFGGAIPLGKNTKLKRVFQMPEGAKTRDALLAEIAADEVRLPMGATPSAAMGGAGMDLLSPETVKVGGMDWLRGRNAPKRAGKLAQIPGKQAQAVSELDNLHRYAAYLYQRRIGKTRKEAIELVRKIHFEVDQSTPLWRGTQIEPGMRDFFFLASWLKEFVPFAVRSAAENPEIYYRLIKTQYGNEYDPDTPDWIAEQPRFFQTPTLDGSEQFTYAGRTPAEEALREYQGFSSDPLEYPLEKLNPPMRWMIEKMKGENMFYDAPIKDRDTTTNTAMIRAMDAAGQFIPAPFSSPGSPLNIVPHAEPTPWGENRVRVDPDALHNLSSFPPAGRMHSTLSHMERAREDEGMWGLFRQWIPGVGKRTELDEGRMQGEVKKRIQRLGERNYPDLRRKGLVWSEDPRFWPWEELRRKGYGELYREWRKLQRLKK